LKHLNTEYRHGPKPIIERGSKDSIAIRTAFLEYSSLPQAKAARKRGFLVLDSTASRIANHYRDQPQKDVEGLDRPIKRRIAPQKPYLTVQNKEARVQACHQILKILDAGGIIICSDETYIAANGGAYGKPKFSAPQGLYNSNEYAVPQEEEGHTWMEWVAGCSDHSIERPTRSYWDKDLYNTTLQVELGLKLAEWNRKRREEAEYHRAQSALPNTPESNELEASHADTKFKNDNKRAQGQRGCFRKTPA